MQVGWKVIRDFMDVLASKGRKYAIYRGHSDCDWALVPSIYRPAAIGISHPNHLREWKKRASRFASPLPRDDIEWLILAQHYGLATALLDWTTSPLVALFFACDDPDCCKSEGCVWRVMQTDFEDPHDTFTVDPFAVERSKPFLVNAIGQNVRSTAQESLLSLHTSTDYTTLEAERIFSVGPTAKVSTLSALEKLGFTGERLHFDITRLVSRFKQEMAGRRIAVH